MINKKDIFISIVLVTISFHSLKGQTTNLIKRDSILKFEFQGMRIGVAENEEGPTGTTVFYFPDGVMAAGDIRGGATGTLNSSVVSTSYERKMINAVVFSGGSWFGLSAATGVANEIKNIKAKEGNVDHVPGVLGAIIYDVGDRRFSRVTPDDQLGKEALNSAKQNWFPLGAKGAGRFAMQGGYYFNIPRDKGVDSYDLWPHSGQGGAFATIGKTKIAVFTVVNALGAIVDRNGKVVRCHRNSTDEDCPSIEDLIRRSKIGKQLNSKDKDGPTENTTLTLVVTNQKLPFWALQRMATQVHTSMGRGIQPFSTQFDGDVLYAVTTGEIDNSDLSPIDLAVAASELAWDAILNSVPQLPALPKDTQSVVKHGLFKSYVGIYNFYGGSQLTISENNNGLTAKFKGNGRIYFDENKEYRLKPATNGLFIIDAPSKDVIRFNQLKESSVATSMTINPGPWHIEAKRN
jgi:L-aminopeptidase/D-esterase-like protein